MSEHTATPWKAVSSVQFDSGLTYTSVQPVDETADERTSMLKMMNGEFHICRMSHTAARHRIDLYKANAEFIVRAVNAHDELIKALQAIVERSNIDPLGTGKVTDMRRIASLALAKHGGDE